MNYVRAQFIVFAFVAGAAGCGGVPGDNSIGSSGAAQKAILHTDGGADKGDKEDGGEDKGEKEDAGIDKGDKEDSGNDDSRGDGGDKGDNGGKDDGGGDKGEKEDGGQ